MGSSECTRSGQGVLTAVTICSVLVYVQCRVFLIHLFNLFIMKQVFKNTVFKCGLPFLCPVIDAFVLFVRFL